MRRPLIAISMRSHPRRAHFYLERSYAEAVRAAGGIPILVPLLPDRALLFDLVERCDGVLLSGSHSDVDPRRYGHSPHARLRSVLPERDQTDWLLLEAAEVYRRPVLAICYGMQVLNVFRGGTLYQDIASEREGAVRHEPGAPGEHPIHRIRIAAGTLLAHLAGGTMADVNSFHHQAVRDVGRDLTPIAWSEDGIIEALLNTRPELFILGVQWHPELTFASDAFSRAIFEHFLHAAARRAS
ncbi:Gamma-glutamyl-gamma-aminobutyrate hydrolase PuuD [bacterium HR10]|nr:Gamma-glutamyl-gamma-aminobutyrate hydrolase PuuD [bacterium HR10]